jgi:SAM-dependent methyltransferase
MSASIRPEILDHYEVGVEASRLAGGTGRLELARTQELIQRFAPPSPAFIYDIGGGPGVYASWLARRGYSVHLLDPVPLHVEQALRESGDQPLASAAVGDARNLPYPDASADVVLLLGPLYHLPKQADRIRAWQEAERVLRPGGVVLAAAISRFASVLDGLRAGFLTDDAFAAIVAEDLRSGCHRNTTGHPAHFTTAYFHRPEELQTEVQEAGLRHEATLAVEGPAWLLGNFDEWWDEPARRERLLWAVRAVEAEPALLGASAHLIVVCRK